MDARGEPINQRVIGGAVWDFPSSSPRSHCRLLRDDFPYCPIPPSPVRARGSHSTEPALARNM